MRVNIKKGEINLQYEESIKKTLIVCSHERSGTHFLMNSIAANSKYSVDPFLNFDSNFFGDMVNFYSTKGIENFFKKIISVSSNNKTYYLSSIVKSHHNCIYFNNLFNNPNFIFIYIYRNPIDTLISYWNYINYWDWHEGPKKKTIYSFIQSAPEGQMLRYQAKSYNTIFDRWASHVSSWYEQSKNTNNIIFINYENLNEFFEQSCFKIFKSIGINNQNLVRPAKNNYIDTPKSNIINNDKDLLVEYINQKIKDYPLLLNELAF